MTLDSFVRKNKIDRIDFIRMDVEGYEVEVIKGMLNTLQNMPPPLKLFFEIHNKVFEEPETTIGPILEQLLTFGFKPKYIILPNKILNNVSANDFIRIICSYRYECPHILLEK